MSLLPQTKSYGQENDVEIVSKPTYALGVTGGVGSLGVRDRVISSFRYDGSYAPLGFHFENRSEFKKYRLSFEFFNNPLLKTEANKGFEYKGELGEFYPPEKDGLDFSTLRTQQFWFTSSQLYMIKSTRDKKYQTYLGFDFNISRFKKEFLQFEYINKLTDRFISLGFVFNLERTIKKHVFEYNLSIPVLIHARRSLTNEDSQPREILHQKFVLFSGFESQLSYRFLLSKRFSLKGSYAFRYNQITFPEKEQLVYSQLTAGIFFHF